MDAVRASVGAALAREYQDIRGPEPADHVAEKNYVIGWVLWGIGQDKDAGHKRVFKGGTCLKKCYLETYRFSEDLDFTVIPDGPINPEDGQPILKRILDRVHDESGINFSLKEPLAL